MQTQRRAPRGSRLTTPSDETRVACYELADSCGWTGSDVWLELCRISYALEAAGVPHFEAIALRCVRGVVDKRGSVPS